ncbi:Matrixin [Singulisphaera acidiphila]|uniref:Matrixin n=1 Tax=Singulisphaera acidiphila (strain ATCC BAA-1392 / DSM 18658 / VKM B-2454 / MOB10) TaxID=886293 RepID=L0DAY6_SINAD|nr:Matrixin [Singulisphaera acidiphila]AGA26544.1 Matrixin [Singulisphaera acidiphila DSM 18658]
MSLLRRRTFLSISGLLACSFSLGGEEPSPDVLEPPAYDSFLIIPLRLHLLTASDLPEIDCRLTDDDLARILRKVNGIWNKAGIHWGLESIVREPAARTDQFRLARELNGVVPLERYSMLVPELTRLTSGINVYYIHKFSVNGVWMGGDFAMVQETAGLRPVEGGIDEPIPRVTAHELGHALGLSHRQNRTNLLASGTTGTRLNTDEVATARRKALKIPGTLTVETLRKNAADATSQDSKDEARRLWNWLAEIPGDASKDALRRRDEVGAPQETQ